MFLSFLPRFALATKDQKRQTVGQNVAISNGIVDAVYGLSWDSFDRWINGLFRVDDDSSEPFQTSNKFTLYCSLLKPGFKLIRKRNKMFSYVLGINDFALTKSTPTRASPRNYLNRRFAFHLMLIFKLSIFTKRYFFCSLIRVLIPFFGF